MGSITSCLAKNLKTLRKEKGLTQGDLARRAGMSPIFVQGIESERRWLSPASARALAKALDVHESRLFENCFAEEESRKKRSAAKRLARAKFEHVPDDIFNALATTCCHPDWRWETIRWIIQGYERSRLAGG